MKQNWLHRFPWALGLLVLALSGCTKMNADYATMNPQDDPYNHMDSNSQKVLAIGTFRIHEGVETVRIDASSWASITNPEAVSDLADGTRIFFEFSPRTQARFPDFCTEAVYVHWASALEVGTVSGYTLSAPGNDPMEIVTDWITSLEDGFLTIHYQIRSSGSVQHTFTLASGEKEGEYVLLHDAHGDRDGSLTEGIICFPVVSLLPETGGETVTLSLDYLNLDHTRSRLIIDYRSPE